MVDYYEYIKSEAWRIQSEPIRKKNGGMCECCNMRYGDSVHHRTYQHLGDEREEELIHLCTPCHEMVHDKGKSFIWPSRLPILNKLKKEQNG